MNPDHNRAAIERIGIEKPSDVTLVMEEVGRMEAEEKIVESMAKAIWMQRESREVSPLSWGGALERHEECPHTYRVAMRVMEEARAAYDALVKAVREVKG